MDLSLLGGDRKEFEHFKVGDTVKVYVRIKEGGKERVQSFEGIVIARSGPDRLERFTVRKISYGIGVEKIFFLNSPSIEKIEILRRAKTTRAKLYYLREKVGKERRVSGERKLS